MNVDSYNYNYLVIFFNVDFQFKFDFRENFYNKNLILIFEKNT